MSGIDVLSQLLNHVLEISLVIAIVLSLAFLWLTIRRIRSSRWISSGLHTGLAVLFAVLAVILAGIAINIHSYQRLTYEQAVAELMFKKIADRQFLVRMDQPNGRSDVYDLRGDQWQLDARVLKWQGLANLLGYDAMYRLERLSGRYSNADEEISESRTVYDLAGFESGVDLWQWVQGHQNYLPWLDAIYGSATYLPMTDGAAYSVTLSQSGLLARQSTKP